MSDPGPDDTEGWKAKLLAYYGTNAPEKAAMVTDALLAKHKGKYAVLFGNIVKKYGPPGHPKAPSSAGAAGRAPSRPAASAKKPVSAAGPRRPGAKKETFSTKKGPAIGDFHDDFVRLVAGARPASSAADEHKEAPVVVDQKASNGVNGLETSTFTVCMRIRPVLAFDGSGGNKFTCVFPGEVHTKKKNDYKEECVILKPKLSLQGLPALEKKQFDFDHTFGPHTTPERVFNSIGQPLCAKALAGQVGVVFAYGQTGSGKTHTMSGLMRSLANELYACHDKRISFSYMEILGSDCQDCLSANGKAKVKIGELLDGRAVARNLSVHPAADMEAFQKLVAVASSRRSTAATERNAQSSRSHGVGIVTVAHSGYAEGEGPAAGVLYVIDLAGSERVSDSKNHSAERMKETKAINVSLMSLKDCIRARTLASRPSAERVHVPYRRSLLTLLMKDVFDVACPRLCSTVVIAHVSPLAKDVGHSTNTLQYAAPLRVAVQSKKVELEVDLLDPALWSHQRTGEWVLEAGEGQVEPGVLLPNQADGMFLCRMPEPEVHRRIIASFPESQRSEANGVAKKLYSTLWTAICDAKTRRRRPNGTIISQEEEEDEIRKAEEDMKAKQAVWAEREKGLQSEKLSYMPFAK